MNLKDVVEKGLTPDQVLEMLKDIAEVTQCEININVLGNLFDFKPGTRENLANPGEAITYSGFDIKDNDENYYPSHRMFLSLMAIKMDEVEKFLSEVLVD